MHAQACIPLELCKSYHGCLGVYEVRYHLAKDLLTLNLVADTIKVTKCSNRSQPCKENKRERMKLYMRKQSQVCARDEHTCPQPAVPGSLAKWGWFPILLAKLFLLSKSLQGKKTLYHPWNSSWASASLIFFRLLFYSWCLSAPY